MGANKSNKKQQQQTQKNSQSQQPQVQTGKKQKNKQQGKQTSTQKSNTTSNCCWWMFGTLLVSACIVAAICYDVQRNGNGVFEKSATGKFLKDTGALPYIEAAALNTLHYGARGYQWAEANLPVYFSKIKEVLTPYALFSCDLTKVVWNNFKILYINFCEILNANYVLVCKNIDNYAPGLIETIETIIKTSWELVNSTSKVVYHSSVNFFKTKIFVGQLSPENLSIVLNQTQQRAGEYYMWFHQQVDTYAKIK